MKKINIAYFGSPDFSALFLEKLIIDKSINQLIEVKFVVTQEDKPVGRKQIRTPTPVNIVSQKAKIPIFLRFNDFRQKNSVSSFLKNIDLALVYAYGNIVPKELLSLPKYGFWNIHPSLLPKYRGPSPIASPLINGDKTTGVTIIKMDASIDHGSIIAQESLTIQDTDYRMDLEKKLTDLGFEMFKNLILKLLTINYQLQPKQQNHKDATYTKKFSKNDGFVEFKKLKDLLLHPTNYELQTFYNLFRALSPWPGIWTILPNGKRLKIIQLSINNQQLTIKSVQLEGKSEVDFETFNKAYKIF